MTGRDSGPPGASRGDNPTEVLRASASLLARCAGCWLDEHERAAGWKVYYAIDVDVIATYMAPARNPRFGAVLSAERRPAELLARLLSDFVLRQVRGSAVPTDGCTSLFIIPPHDDELHRMLNAVHSKAHERKIAPGRWTELAELVRGVESDPEIAATLVAHAGDLLRLLDDDGPHEELNRFGSLPRNRLLNLFRYRESSDGEEFSFPSPPVDSSSPEFDDYVDRYERWRNALQRVRTEAVEQERPYATRRDARVLATFLALLSYPLAGEPVWGLLKASGLPNSTRQ